MSKKKGLSFEEKRARMMEIFFETKDVFQLKDIEKIASKDKGITSMSVKEVLQSLVDDGMVDTDRIGTSNYFWAFPSKALHARKRKLEELQTQFAETSQKKEILQKGMEKSKIGRENTAERAALMKELAALQQKKEQLKAEIEKYKEYDPDVVEEMQMNRQQSIWSCFKTTKTTSNGSDLQIIFIEDKKASVGPNKQSSQGGSQQMD
ncbi:meiotic nuclear division protein 1 homolog isoform X12 [Gallus gallus]|uniref:meiotic nuclear division protein 1 homolog isoform X12 n=1 Tax=Gallus gallus TaxID=9031 RepID=UPI000739EB0F|nr:meiotic nuclear division protein 1 homolog isoform X12 [Gallus gallus]|eukprot:XP_015140767.1 meiotic nuclear division protein 1 homolog isoform X8 [Gallus gallus]